MNQKIAFIGFGEAGSTFATSAAWRGHYTAFDLIAARSTAPTLAGAVAGTGAIISVVTADQALAAACNATQQIAKGTFFFDMNSVAPETKRKAAQAIEAAGGRYVDVAVMAPVDPAGLSVPLLLSGPHSNEGAAVLRELGFDNVRVLPGDVGRASSVKMIRSVMVKGVEALTAEMMAAADVAGVTDEVLASLGSEWAAKAAYNLERMTTHGVRRAAEMEESAKTLAALGVDPVMTRGTVIRQREMAAAPLREAA